MDLQWLRENNLPEQTERDQYLRFDAAFCERKLSSRIATTFERHNSHRFSPTSSPSMRHYSLQKCNISDQTSRSGST